jgi:hypothetical protein
MRENRPSGSMRECRKRATAALLRPTLPESPETESPSLHYRLLVVLVLKGVRSFV